MATSTSNYGLTKPERSDNYNVDVMGENMDIIDAELKEHDNVVNGGAVKSSSITNSGTITSTGKITANGGIAGKLEGFLFVKGTVGTSGDENYATLAAQNLTVTATSASSPNTLTIANYSKISLPKRHCWGVYTRASDLNGTTNPSVSNRTVTVKARYIPTGYGAAQIGIKYKKSTDTTWTTTGRQAVGNTDTTIATFNATVGSVYQFVRDTVNPAEDAVITVSISAGTTYKVKYATP